jgi:hypothetical protein
VRAPLLSILAALALAGCGSAGSSAEDFRGAEADVAEVVEELQAAGRGADPERICAELLAPALVDRIEAGGLQCAEEMTEAVEDVNDYDLEVRDVTVTGTQARARVQQGDDGPTATFEFTRQRDGWRATSLGG